MINDCRRSVMSVMRAAEMKRWTETHAAGQGRLASSGMVDSCRDVMRHGSLVQQSTLVHVATNSIHHHWHSAVGAARSTARLVQLRCHIRCATDLTIAHLAVCQRHSAYRNKLRDAIVNLLDRHESTHDWLRVNNKLNLHPFMTAMMPSVHPIPVGSDVTQLRHAQLMIGAFTKHDVEAAITRIGLDKDKGAKSIMIKMRLECLDHIREIYNKMKESM